MGKASKNGSPNICIMPEDCSKIIRMKPSLFMHKFHVDQDIIALFHSLNLKLLFIHNELFSKIIKLVTSGYITFDYLERNYNNRIINGLLMLYENEMLVPETANEICRLHQISQTITGEPKIEILYLILTMNCNFDCTYCYIRSNNKTNMPASVATSAIEYFLSEPAQYDRRIIFYGGEPLLNFDVLKYSVEFTKKSITLLSIDRDSVHFEVITNGSLITNKIARFFAKEDISVSVSLDGPEQVNDRYRRYIDNRGTFADTINGINILKENNVDLGISCTIGNHNALCLDDVFLWIYETLGIKNIGFNIIQGFQSDEEPCTPIKNVTKNIIRCFKIAREKEIYEQRIMRIVNSFVYRKIYPIDCGGCGRQIVITPDGKYGPCPGFISQNMYFKNLPVSNIKEDQTFAEWAKRSPLNIPECIKCEALGLCGGGCPYHAFINAGDIWELDERHCIYVKDVLSWLLQYTYQHIRESTSFV